MIQTIEEIKFPVLASSQIHFKNSSRINLSPINPKKKHEKLAFLR